MTGFEPAASRSQSECSTKLSYIPLTPQAGFEPAANRLEGEYSGPLSYWGMWRLSWRHAYLSTFRLEVQGSGF